MGFFGDQSAARSHTVLLVVLFVGALLATLAVLSVVIGLALLAFVQEHPRWLRYLWPLSALIAVLVVVIASWHKMRQLRGGGAAIARLLGGRPLGRDRLERRLRHVAEEVAIAAGTAPPRLYLLPEEKGINAFVAGFSRGDAVLCVTRGALEMLRRDELQGLLAHEQSQILHGDLALQTRMVGPLHGVLLFGLFGERLANAGPDDEPIWFLAFFGLIFMVVGYFGTALGSLIKAAVCRQRALLADASAVAFTRNPHGLAGALRTIGGYVRGSRLRHPRRHEFSHLFFGQSFAGEFSFDFATHPPLADRIRRLDPTFDGTFPEITPPEVEQRQEARRRFDIAATAGALPEPRHLAWAGALRDALPDELTAAIDRPESAAPVVLQLVAGNAPVGPEQRLPLLDLAIPALRRLPPEAYAEFRAELMERAGADGELSLFEWALRHLLLRHVDPAFAPVAKPTLRYYSLMGLRSECSRLLSTLARVGGGDPAVAFAEAEQRLSLPRFVMSDAAACSWDQLDRDLDRLARTPLPERRRLLDAAAAIVATDGIVHVAEAELIRAIADAIDAPLPPLV